MAKTIAEFVKEHGIRMTASRVTRNPNMDQDEWHDKARHWKCDLVKPGSRMSTYFSQGPAITREPTVEDVLDCLASDAQGADQDFESWASDLGYDTDSRSAERTYNTIRKVTQELQDFLGDYELFEELTGQVERL